MEEECGSILFPFQWCCNTSCEGTYYAVTGGGTCTTSENPDVFFYIVFKYCWIFIHVAEAGLPCRCVLKVFHLPSPNCTSDNLQYYTFCLTEFIPLQSELSLLFPFFSPSLICSSPYSLSPCPSFYVRALHFVVCLSMCLTLFVVEILEEQVSHSSCSSWPLVNTTLCEWCWWLEVMQMHGLVGPCS